MARTATRTKPASRAAAPRSAASRTVNPTRSLMPSREPEGRIEEMTYTPPGDRPGMLHIDPRAAPKGMSLKWCREYTHGERDMENVRASLLDGWKAVLADQMSAFAAPLLPGEARTDNLIRRGGMILMMRPTDFTNAALDYFRTENAATLASLDRDRVAKQDGKNFKPISELAKATERNGRFEDE